MEEHEPENPEASNQILYGFYHVFLGIFRGLRFLIVTIYTLLSRFLGKNKDIIFHYVRLYKTWLFSILSEHYKVWFRVNGALLSLILFFILAWLPFFAPLIAPFYMSTEPDIEQVKVYPGEGLSTIHGLLDPLERIADGILMTNYFGVNDWDDNLYNQQIGFFVMYRQELLILRDYLARNRSSSGQNEHLVEAHNFISVDSEAMMPVNFDRQVRKTMKALKSYLKELEQNKASKNNFHSTVFIANPDNLAKSVRLLREQLLSVSNANADVDFMNADNNFYRLRGHLIALYQFLKGLETDFKAKMTEKGAYTDSYLPLISDLKEAISFQPIFVMEWFKHDVSALRSRAQSITIKMNEFAEKLADG